MISSRYLCKCVGRRGMQNIKFTSLDHQGDQKPASWSAITAPEEKEGEGMGDREGGRGQ